MRKALRWIGIAVGSLIALALIAAAGIIVSADMRMSRAYSITPETVAIPSDTISLARGQHLVTSFCQGCHAQDLGGAPFLAVAPVGHVDAANLTAGAGGVGASYSDADWVRTLRHGVAPSGRSVMIMPSESFASLSDADLGAIIAYLKTVPPVNRPSRPRDFTLLGKLLYGVGALGNMLAAELIAQSPPAPPPAPTVGPAYGGYLVTLGSCRNCHGAQLAGGKNSDPQAPFAPNLTPGGDLRNWDEAKFIAAMRTGITPDNRQLGEGMPWKEIRGLSDGELRSIWLFLSSQPALDTAAQ